VLTGGSYEGIDYAFDNDPAIFAVGNTVLVSGAGAANFTAIPGQATNTGVIIATSATLVTVLAGAADAAANAAALGPAVSGCVTIALTYDVCTVYLNKILAAGDVFTVAGPTADANSNAIASTSATVPAVAATTIPTATMTCFSTSADEVYIDFSEPVNGLTLAALTGDTALGMDMIPGTNSFLITLDGTPAAGTVLTFDMSTVTSQRGIAGGAAAYDAKATCTNNTTKPTIVSASYTTTYTTHAAVTLAGSASTIVATMNKTGLAPGVLGNQYGITIVDTASATGAVSVDYNAATKIFQLGYDIGGALAPNATAVAGALNNDATFSQYATAVVTVSNGAAWDDAATANAFAAGDTKIDVTSVFNQPIRPILTELDDGGTIVLSGTLGNTNAAASDTIVFSAANSKKAYADNTIKLRFALTTSEYVNVPTAASYIEFGLSDVTAWNSTTNNTVKQKATLTAG
jgi:hypothetical protein